MGFVDVSDAPLKKEKRGFKSDRYDRYQEHRLKEMGAKVATKKKPNAAPAKVKEVRFDEADRKEFLLGFHKRKNERRVTAFKDAKHKIKRENQKFRQEQREEARRAYNAFAKVPILPDYSYQLPNYIEGADKERGKQDDDVDDEDAKATSSHSTQFYPQEDSIFSEVEGVTVTVQPLRGAGGSAALPTKDFADLPQTVAEELKRLQKSTKGPSRTKPAKNTLKTLEKIRKIQKHSRKGHGKKTTKGKKKNR